MTTPLWWEDARTPIAFLIAPLAVPFLMTWYLRPSLADLDSLIAVVVSEFVAYISAFVLGIPVYRFLYMRKLTAFWIAPVVGFVVGTIVMSVLFWLSFAATDLARPDLFRNALRFGGVSGAVVGAIHWMIARPDRRQKR
jgi:hypothetical protein